MQKQQECGKSKKKQRKKIPYQYCPEGLDTQIWQTLLRKQIAKEEKLQINCVDEVNASGEYRVRNPKTEQIYKTPSPMTLTDLRISPQKMMTMRRTLFPALPIRQQTRQYNKQRTTTYSHRATQTTLRIGEQCRRQNTLSNKE